MKVILLSLVASVLLAACEQVASDKATRSDVAADNRYVRSQVDPARLKQGRDLFRKKLHRMSWA